MKKIVFFLVMLVMGIEAAQAQQLVVRSGDHPTFSRITIPIPVLQSWNAQTTAEGVKISLIGFSGGFDISGVFARMQANRISSIDITGDSLLLTLNCDCSAKAFRSGPLLVIDVGDPGSVFTTQLLDAENMNAESKKNTTNLAAADAVLPWMARTSSQGIQRSPNNPVIASMTDTYFSKDRSTSLLREIQDSLTREIANAASAGLLKSNYSAKIGHSSDIIEKYVEKEAKENSAVENKLNYFRNIKITDSMDRLERLEIDPTSFSGGATCPKDSLSEIGTWGDERNFSAQIGQARNILVDARDGLNREAIKALAQNYLYFGFGAEAVNTLKLDTSLMDKHPELVEIASIMDGQTANRSGVFKHFTDCPSNAALWAILSFDKILPEALVNTNAILEALNKLPNHLRQVLAPAVSSRLLAYGDSSNAAAALRTVERLPESLGSNSLLAQADIANETGHSSENILGEIVGHNNEQSPYALIKLVEGKLARREPLSKKTTQLVEAYAQELRGTEIGNKMHKIHIIALSQSNHFDEAFDYLHSHIGSLSPESVIELHQEILEQLTKTSEDVEFLEAIFAHEMHLTRSLQNSTKFSIIDRLADLGFASLAQEILSTVPDDPRTKDRQILAARVAILLNQPFQAQAALIGIEGVEAELILAQAKQMTGAYAEAAKLYSNNDANQQAAEAGWLSDDWRALTSADSQGFGAIAELANIQASDAEIGPLARANIALEESNKMRGAIDQLLQDSTVGISFD
ncbi:hypothetical protein [Sulfitobacter guttiformis]|uniref:Uncharacterized protein n=1 Tax=Sulfitobacter guttiformis TaxID=74349 RepID=A0A420DSL9_9RHOB|nr:hypothetical protein [Sulfitobacter guttiformis]KIN74579.1 hypothetical protein Z949_3778 [Sulfitobacter guttiformis KCTC 32187]RKE97158.1 hypothetical protein C8N30_1751 [Sulfitobacter guttiformis]